MLLDGTPGPISRGQRKRNAMQKSIAVCSISNLYSPLYYCNIVKFLNSNDIIYNNRLE